MENQLILTSVSIDDLRNIIQNAVAIEMKKNNSSILTANKQDELINGQQVMDLLNISYTTLYLWKQQGKLPFHRIGRRVYFKRDEVINALKKIDLKGKAL